MEMKHIQSGRLRSVGYDARERLLRVELDDGSLIEYTGIGSELWRRLSTSASAWSVYRDAIEEEYTGRKVAGSTASKAGGNPLDALFK
ncbi:KTSC domain-containing protein [Propionivibrio dicarboxylicus]|uniref:KTSC domain-containing protein n=1 Tax=Propionivibrio dicarboxylicus TaxID=83767 RepID=A0A1G7WL06_9RHOO|nr:KTSC domain-containing protein [Propionivibrio dicarboxylicus]SDG72681.1 KTSC domain-containing protein [Propionivibrio dicarboxylicus]